MNGADHGPGDPAEAPSRPYHAGTSPGSRLQDKGPPVRTYTVRRKEKKARTALDTVIEIVAIVLAAFVLALLVQAFIVKPFTIHQISMEPTLSDGDRILLNRLSYRFREPEAGDVVVFHSPLNGDDDLVKRVVAEPGDTVMIRDGDLYVNGNIVEEPYLRDQDFRGVFPETVIPEGKVFVLGDNRNNSGDSRVFGPIDADSIVGCAFAVYWPIGHWRGL